MSVDRPADPRERPLHLGDQWWVLDNALQLYRELGEKKGREVLLLRALKVAYPGFPEGPVFAAETPDFLVQATMGRTVGLEFVEVHRGSARRRGSRHRERQQAEETVLRLAEERYYAEDPPGPVRAHLTWPQDSEAERPGPLPRPTGELAGEVARLVREGAPRWVGEGRLELGPTEFVGMPLESILHGLSARRTGFVGDDGRDSPWGRTLSYIREAANVADLECAIAGKDRLCEACRRRCDEAWLVVALTGGPASFDGIEEAVLAHHFRSRFDRVVLLCPGGAPDRRAVTVVGL